MNMKQIADITFYNGNIITVDSNNEVVEVVAIKGDTIIYCGPKEGSEAYVDDNTKMWDLKGNTLMPGFIDSHVHFCELCLSDGLMINISFEKAKSVKDILDSLESAVKTKNKGEWIILTGYDHNKLEEKRHPTIEELDAIAPDNPVSCIRCCGHMAVYNSLAIEIGGVKDSIKFSEDEVIMKDGKLTGLLKEAAFMHMVAFFEYTDEEIIQIIKAADKRMLENGVTTVHEAGVYMQRSLELTEKLANSREIKTKVKAMLFDSIGKESAKKLITNYIENVNERFAATKYFELNLIKIMLDGSSSGPSSAMKEPYSHDSELKGVLMWEQEEVDEIAQKVHDAGFRFTAHALGDKAVEMVVEALEKAQKNNPKKGVRHRIEHCGFVNEDLIKRIKALEAIPVANPGFIELNGKDYNRFYGERVNYMFALNSFLKEGICCTISTDASVISENPMFGLFGAINRCDGKTGEPVGKNQAIELSDAIKMYTYNAAYSYFEEEIKGSLEVGKVADLVILSHNIMDESIEDIREIQVCTTIIDGEVVYQR